MSLSKGRRAALEEIAGGHVVYDIPNKQFYKHGHLLNTTTYRRVMEDHLLGMTPVSFHIAHVYLTPAGKTALEQP